MKFLKITTIAILITTLTGCATTEGYRKKVDSWKGASDSALVEAWGAPSSTYEAQNGCKFIGYKKSSSGLCRIGKSYYPIESYCETTFKVKGGKIQSCSFRGNNCLAEEIELDALEP